MDILINKFYEESNVKEQSLINLQTRNNYLLQLLDEKPNFERDLLNQSEFKNQKNNNNNNNITDYLELRIKDKKENLNFLSKIGLVIDSNFFISEKDTINEALYGMTENISSLDQVIFLNK